MKEKETRHLSTPALAVIAAVLGVAAGAAWIYGMAPVSGNGPAGQSETVVAEAVVPDATCAAEADIAAAIDPLAKGEVAALAVQEAPRGLPTLSFIDDADRQMSLADFAGRPLLVNLWATWCAPCREEMPALSELEAAMGGEDFSVVAINIDTGERAKPEAFLKEIGVDNLGLYRDPSMGVFNTLKKEGLALGLPVTLIVSAKGCLLGIMNGPANWSGADAKALIGKLTEATPAS
jgi:Thiol-disulfide isomerase and thioredoxins